jgi:hypothetical protein
MRFTRGARLFLIGFSVFLGAGGLPAAFAMNGQVSLSGAASCSAATEGTIRYNITSQHVELCTGSAWVYIFTDGTNGTGTTSGAMSMVGSGTGCNGTTEGAVKYDTTGKTLSFCTGSSWQIIPTYSAAGTGTIGAIAAASGTCASGQTGFLRYNAATKKVEVCTGSAWAIASVYTYSWQSGSWGGCSVSCGGGSQSRQVWCQRSDSTNLGDTTAYPGCDTGRPSTSQSCNTQVCNYNSCYDWRNAGYTTSGNYATNAAGTIYCDMTTDGGGWSKVVGLSTSQIEALARTNGSRQVMYKCSDSGSAYIVSPAYSGSWSWSNSQVLSGTWNVNGTSQSCGSSYEYTPSSYYGWGFGCSNGGGPYNKIYPGEFDTPSFPYNAGVSGAHSNGSFSICGSGNYGAYVQFIR